MFRSLIGLTFAFAITAEPLYSQVVVDPNTLQPLEPGQARWAQPSQAEIERGHALLHAAIDGYSSRVKQLIQEGNSARSRAEIIKIEWSLGAETAGLARLHEAPRPEYHTAPDFQLARYWYIYAINLGYVPAIYPLAQMYWDGRGGSQDRERAKYLWMWSAQNNDERSLAKLDALGFNLSKERDAAFDKAQAKALSSAAGDHSKDAAEGAAMLFGLMLMGTMARGSESPECQAYHRAMLVGGGIPPGTVIPSCP